jgi:Mrp family chromosome partitioning ATPase
MRKFLAETGERYDRILIDSPPGMIVTDAIILAALTGTALIIAQSGKTPRRALSKLVAICNDVHANVLGIIVNNVSPESLSSYYSYSSYGRQDASSLKRKHPEKMKQYTKTVKRSLSKSAKALESFTRQSLSKKKEEVSVIQSDWNEKNQ